MLSVLPVWVGWGVSCVFRRVTVVIAAGKRPVPFRTRKLSLSAPMVLHSSGCGRVGHCRTPVPERGPTVWVPSSCFHERIPLCPTTTASVGPSGVEDPLRGRTGMTTRIAMKTDRASAARAEPVGTVAVRPTGIRGETGPEAVVATADGRTGPITTDPITTDPGAATIVRALGIPAIVPNAATPSVGNTVVAAPTTGAPATTTVLPAAVEIAAVEIVLPGGPNAARARPAGVAVKADSILPAVVKEHDRSGSRGRRSRTCRRTSKPPNSTPPSAVTCSVSTRRMRTPSPDTW